MKHQNITELPRRSTPARRLGVMLLAQALAWGSIVGLIRGWIWVGLVGMLLARVCEWAVAEENHW